MARFKILPILLTILTSIVLTTSANAEISQLINYQGLLTDSEGNPVADGVYSIAFAIYDAPVGGTRLWSSVDQRVDVSNGIFSYLLGSDTHLPDDIFDRPDRYLAIMVGSDPEISPRTLFTSSAFTFQALRSDTTGYARTIADLCVDPHKVQDDAIRSSHIQNNSIISADIRDGEVTSADIADATLALADIGQNGAADGEVIKWNAAASQWEAAPEAATPVGAPIGGIVAWLKSYPNVPPLSSEYVECNGQTLDDPESPFHGQVIPNLNNGRFLRGYPTSDSTGGSTSHGHVVNDYTSAWAVEGTPFGASVRIIDVMHGVYTNSRDHLPSFYTVVWVMRIK